MSSMFLPPPTQQIHSDIIESAGVEMSVLRLDLMHSWVNGNKWYKLKYNLLEAKERNFTTLLTFGGAYSNHIFATAAAGKLFGLQTIGVIRGEERLPLNPTLSFALEQGMQLVYMSRTIYKQRNSPELQAELQERYGEVFIIPEGGCNLNGVLGCTEILKQAENFDIVCVACGTGTTFVGILLSLTPQQKAIAFPVLKNGGFLQQEIEMLLQNYLAADLPISNKSLCAWELICHYHFGGYAKVNDELLKFSQHFQQIYGIPLDYVYTAKMFYGVMDLLQQGFFSKGDRILLIHTGGLQGNLGIQNSYSGYSIS
ncbi:1-aminocyclopropane-1-carboxylate deaminase/D-cysteine desulfhydrase [Nostoc sp. FACHB-280]|uniref:1-aminocyclopropane-1-carboxylate deaminase/D-cysteine desulfhydrase n=1 Tax=Nostoc sp. FACHB-280 TaxID=2692839 RepID=UPI00168C0F6E|nr:pyridoxal-phosphate dependent enzyme [Nostoc sp. FACHB-280]MBD2494276.1 1-aminocyclopropane-1-carboxylate deaminase/D-cysteine desulfhydrase [Nostoc sp. FACHB-280]